MGELNQGLYDFYSPNVIHIGGIASLVSDPIMMSQGTFTFGGAWPAANLGMFYPFITNIPRLIRQMSHENSTTVAGNVDVGVYNELAQKVVAKGGAAMSGSAVPQFHDLTDTWIMPGLYYMAMSSDSATATFNRTSTPAAAIRAAGVMQLASAYPLPTDASAWVGATNAHTPGLEIHCAATV